MDELLRTALYEGRAGRDEPGLSSLSEDDPLYPKLWRNPCWFSFRLNYLALQFNNPVYGLIQQQLGLLRPEFVVLWSLYLSDELTLTEVVRSSGFPKNTLSRAVTKLDTLGMISRELDQIDQRRVALKLTEKGRAAVEAVEEKMMSYERTMLECLSPAERLNLSEILTKLVVASESWPQQLVPDLEPEDDGDDAS
ncbi:MULTISPECIES: MarR family transcriptional regulator [unclassified Rhizobium]|jgi:DNA-binding MarR family transcriptional regulator|uniref:MarR family winged helix-turn-helix transcriptional regulator n=1 Tax=unclassified Rhizobium TaxID=2613769 RepID=UPI00069212F2|nr:MULTISPECIES: MarR family transcriptional regulator [unclassified Rhizobium]MBN8953603.1 winged helix DNA-binding protein [Rhizobium tropici]OJY79051.1 MAG: hypothetical protein BGP09_24460 [Rhizobium sp. 60-20]RKD67783.1 DNA-binding MarR family transcriptional regulator [Rhizobium sp. WW_1]